MNKGRKITGGKYHANRKKRIHERQGLERQTILGETKRKILRVKGGNKKPVLLRTNQVNLLIKGKIQKTEIKNVEETPQNRFFARQNRLMKGVVIQTPLGKAKITN